MAKTKPHLKSVPRIENKGRKKKASEPRQYDRRGHPVMVMSANGKTHMAWSSQL